MANKKPSRSAPEPRQTPNRHEIQSGSEQPLSAVDVSAEKLRSLKSLNDRLVKETLEKRMEVSILVEVKEALELELMRYVDEKEQVMGELSDARDGVYGLELERNLVCVYMQSQVKAKIDELVLMVEEERGKWRRVCCERDGINVDFDGLFQETGYLRGKVVEMEENERRALEEAEDSRGRCKKLMVETMESKIMNSPLMKENEWAHKLLDESGRVIEGLERRVATKMEEKEGIEKAKKGLEMEKEETGKRIEEAVEKENGMLMELDVLVKELQKKEKDMEMLTRRTVSLGMDLSQHHRPSLLKPHQKHLEQSSKMEEARMETENIIEDVQRESSKLREAISSLIKMSNVMKARNEELLSEIGRLQHALDEVSIERDDARRSFEKLSLLLKGKKRRIEEAMNELDNAKISREDSLRVKKEMEKRIDILVWERDSTEKNLLEAKSRLDELKAKARTADANSEEALALLRKTCLAVCDGDGNEKGGVEEAYYEHKVVEEMQPFVEHLDAIRTSFTNKEKMVEEMKRRLEAKQAEARKKVSFYTMLTAAIAILAAVSAVYVCKGP